MTPTGETTPRLDELIGTADSARRHDLMPWDLTNAARRKELRAYKLPGNRIAFRRDELDAWAEARKRSSSPATP